jgi:hypothetical protein
MQFPIDIILSPHCLLTMCTASDVVLNQRHHRKLYRPQFIDRPWTVITLPLVVIVVSISRPDSAPISAAMANVS